jgi:hypothetical protein
LDPQQTQLVRIVNQVFEIEKKMQKNDQLQPVQKNIARIQQAFEEMNLRVHNPIGERYHEQRTDCEASIAGNAAKDLFITDVLKPQIFLVKDNVPTLIQKAVVIADNK